VAGNPPNKENVSKTIEYLDGCNDLFERGILNKIVTREYALIWMLCTP